MRMENEDYGLFKCGKDGESLKDHKYCTRFGELKDAGYNFEPLVLESMGGMNKNFRKVINYCMDLKSERSGICSSILKGNYYIDFSMKYQNELLKSIYNHYII